MDSQKPQITSSKAAHLILSSNYKSSELYHEGLPRIRTMNKRSHRMSFCYNHVMTLDKTLSNICLFFVALSTLTLIGSVFLMWNTESGALLYIWFIALLAGSHIYLIYLLVKGRRIARHFVALNIWIIILSFAGIALFMPYLKDSLAGYTCSGFFGVHGSCIDNAKISISILLLNPFVAMSTVLLSVVSFTLQATTSQKG